MNSKLIYTCILGGYDDVPRYKHIADDWDYVLFSDSEELVKEGQIYHWKVRKNNFNERDKTRNSRYEKINPHLIFPEYQYSLYVDGNISIQKNSFYENLKNLINDDVLISIPRHPDRRCVYDEATVIIDNVIDYKRLVNKQMKFLQKIGYPKNNGLFENCLIFRQHNHEKLIKAQNLWWEMLLKYSKRDQLSAMYCFWKNNIKIEPFFENYINHRDCEDIIFIKSAQHTQHLLKQKFSERQINIMSCWIPIKKFRHSFRKYLQEVYI